MRTKDEILKPFTTSTGYRDLEASTLEVLLDIRDTIAREPEKKEPPKAWVYQRALEYAQMEDVERAALKIVTLRHTDADRETWTEALAELRVALGFDTQEKAVSEARARGLIP